MRYHFDISGLGSATQDVEGMEIGTSEDMHSEAGKVLAEVALHHLKAHGEMPMALQVAVRVGATTVAKATLTLALDESPNI